MSASAVTDVEAADLPARVREAVDGGERFAAFMATAQPDGSVVLRTLLAGPAGLRRLEVRLGVGRRGYPALTPSVPAAAPYEREVHDLFGIEPIGHPRLEPLVLPIAAGDRPRPGHGQGGLVPIEVEPDALPVRITGEGMFTISYGPVRSGVFESIEYLVETFGEDIPHLGTRIHYKHRGIDRRFEDLSLADAVLLAERVEGTSSVAHALAFCQALESLAAVQVPPGAALLRLVHAELERIANHLDSISRHCEGAAQAVAYARMTRHKEHLMRLRAALCGHRFGRGVVVAGGVSGPPAGDLRVTGERLADLAWAVAGDAAALMATPSFLDRLRGTGRLAADVVRRHGALGPVGRGSGLGDDVRADRPYGAYRSVGFTSAALDGGGDALARQRVRLAEIDESFRLVAAAVDQLTHLDAPIWSVEVAAPDGVGIGSVEAPNGELIYVVELDAGRLVRVKPRSPSFHNLALLPAAFGGDILTDFVFIEASFGLSVAGAAG